MFLLIATIFVFILALVLMLLVFGGGKKKKRESQYWVPQLQKFKKYYAFHFSIYDFTSKP